MAHEFEDDHESEAGSSEPDWRSRLQTIVLPFVFVMIPVASVFIFVVMPVVTAVVSVDVVVVLGLIFLNVIFIMLGIVREIALLPDLAGRPALKALIALDCLPATTEYPKAGFVPSYLPGLWSALMHARDLIEASITHYRQLPLVQMVGALHQYILALGTWCTNIFLGSATMIAKSLMWSLLGGYLTVFVVLPWFAFWYNRLFGTPPFMKGWGSRFNPPANETSNRSRRVSHSYRLEADSTTSRKDSTASQLMSPTSTTGRRTSRRMSKPPNIFCSACHERPLAMMPFRCQHVALCSECAPTVSKSGNGCPICRCAHEHPRDMWRVYIVEA